MQPYRIKILGDEFSVYSSLDENDGINLKEQNTSTVIINPSLSRDFEVRAYDKHGKLSCDVIAPVIAGVTFLSKKRGLPLTEFSFEAFGKNLDVFYTGNRIFIREAQICKLLYTKSTMLKGCDISYRDIEAGGVFRTIAVENISGLDRELLSLLILSGENTPSVTLASSVFDGEISFSSLSDFSASGFFEITKYTVAAYNEYLNSKGRKKRFFARDENFSAEFENGFIKFILN